MDSDTVLQALITTDDENADGEALNIADGMFAIARSLDSIARALRDLGNANASTPMGAIEAHGAAMLEAADRISAALTERSS